MFGYSIFSNCPDPSANVNSNQTFSPGAAGGRGRERRESVSVLCEPLAMVKVLEGREGVGFGVSSGKGRESRGRISKAAKHGQSRHVLD